jgi:flagellum-specific peptidoglycan hydrolase FlgJ
MIRFVFVLFFLPLSLLSQKTTEVYIQNWKSECIEQMEKYGIPACITMAQGILESASGTSDLATKANNHFGIKCHNEWAGDKFFKDDDKKDECFRVYKNAQASFEDHSIFLKKARYAELFDLAITDYKGWANGLKQCGYATNPKYPQLLIELIDRYRLYELDETKKVVSESDDLKKKRVEQS